MQADERVRVEPVPAHAVPAVHHDHADVRVLDQRIDECHSHGACADYLVVGAGAMGMAFIDALIENADVSVIMVDRRHGVGGHWLDAYPFVRLHQASAFYGVASTVLGDGRIQPTG